MTAYSRIFTDIQTSVIEKLRLDATLDATKTSEYINQALTAAATDSKFFTGSSTASALAAAASTQALPSAVIELEYVACSYGGTAPLLVEASFEQILFLRGLGTAAGPPTHYVLRQATVEFWPAAVGGEILTYYGAVFPDEWTGSTVCPLPEPYPSLLEAGALVQGAAFKKDPLLGQYQADYRAWQARWMAFCNRRKGARPQTIEVRGVGGRWPFPNPSTDVPWLP